MRRLVQLCSIALATALSARVADAQTTVYHLHNEASTINAAKQLRTAAPDVASVAIQSANLKNSTGIGTRLISRFETQTSVPNVSGYLPANSVVTVTVYMKKSANYGTFYPYAALWLNNYFGAGSVFLCRTPVPSDQNPPDPVPAALTTTLTQYTMACRLSQAVTLTTSDRFFVEVDSWLVTGPGNHNLTCEVDIEGTPGGNFDSKVEIPNPLPPPTITSISPSAAPVGWPLSISGTNFGTSSGTVKFNSTAASVQSWAGSSISATVPAGLAPGSVNVTVTNADGATTAPASFTVVGAPVITSIAPSTGHISDPVVITGSNFMPTQGTSAVTFYNGIQGSPTNWSDTSITVPIPSDASTGNVVVTVSGQPSNGYGITVIPPPTLTVAAPTAAHRGDPVTVTGTNFGASQGSSSIEFNGVAASPNSWSETSITAPVPGTATSGDIVVKVANQPSNALPFTVIIPGTLSGTITRNSDGAALPGASIQPVLSGVIKGSATAAPDGSYSISLDPATYDVRISATGYSTELRQAVVITPSNTTTTNVSMFAPGGITGRITQADGVTPIVGAAVTVFSGPAQKATTNTNSLGDYTLGLLHPSGYTIQAANVGYRTSEQGVVVNDGAVTSKNISLDAAASGPVRYAYDELGRLVQVTDPSGESAIYRYDAVGNIVGIERPGSTSVSISAFTPTSALPGATATIYGAGFSAVPGENDVRFNGTIASVLSATPTQLTVTVPNATSGPIGVTSPTGSGVSASAFTILANSGVPTITGFTPNITAGGASLTVTGTNFETVPTYNNVLVNLSPAQLTSATSTVLQGNVTSAVGTGRVHVATPLGAAVSADYLWVAPAPYTVGQVESTGTLAFGVASGLSISALDKIELRAFEGTEGHRAAIEMTDGSGGYIYAYLYDAFGNLLRSGLWTGVPGFVDTVALRATGTYSIVVAPYNAAPASITLKLHDVPADVATPLQYNSPTDVPITVPGQNGSLPFVLAAGHRVSVVQSGGFNCFSGTTSIVDPTGAQVATTCGGYFLDVTPPLAAGTYTLLVDPKDAATGTTSVTLYDVPADDSGAVAINGNVAALDMSTPGRNGFVTFTGTAQQTVTFHLTNNSINRGDLKLFIVSGQTETQIASTPWVGAGDVNWGQTLPPDGTYKLVVDPYDAFTGTTTVSATSP
jgi:YD repeat-containing protein